MVKALNRRLLILLAAAVLLAAALAAQGLGLFHRDPVAQALTGDTGQRIEAIREIARTGAPAEVKVLLGLTSDPDTRVAVESCRRLEQVGLRARGTVPLEPLAAAAADARPEVREAAVVTLGALGDRSAGKTLLEKLRSDPSPEVQAAAADAAGRLRTLEAMPVLLDLLDSPSANVRRSAAQAITKIWQRDHGFNPADPPEKRRALAKAMKADWEWYVRGPAYPYLKARLEKQP